MTASLGTVSNTLAKTSSGWRWKVKCRLVSPSMVNDDDPRAPYKVYEGKDLKGTYPSAPRHAERGGPHLNGGGKRRQPASWQMLKNAQTDFYFSSHRIVCRGGDGPRSCDIHRGMCCRRYFHTLCDISADELAIPQALCCRSVGVKTACRGWCTIRKRETTGEIP
jgi:hypothetical protein